ncbi:uncharacterized protein LOC119179457 [Rhipicephalus microplus]|uniref:uncharacterized protein LOC119179457 n=1 Tax=Rhipicephalus microplus TaxID=6941 RepID=UPI001888D64D|nr:uncharacterized protein LOC119179457 [Rhipicephalus microplus]
MTKCKCSSVRTTSGGVSVPLVLAGEPTYSCSVPGRLTFCITSACILVLLDSGFVMAGAHESQFQGFSKYFNTVTKTGRANIAKSTYLVLGTVGFLFWAKKKASGGSAK